MKKNIFLLVFALLAVTVVFSLITEKTLTSQAQSGPMQVNRCGSFCNEDEVTDCCNKLLVNEWDYAQWSTRGNCYKTYEDGSNGPDRTKPLGHSFVCSVLIVKAELLPNLNCDTEDECNKMQFRYKGAPPSGSPNETAEECNVAVNTEWNSVNSEGYICPALEGPNALIKANMDVLTDPQGCFHDGGSGLGQECVLWGDLPFGEASGECKGPSLFSDSDDASFDEGDDEVDADSPQADKDACEELAETTDCDDWTP